MSETYPFSIPSGVNIIPDTSGTSSFGSAAKPFSGMYAASINSVLVTKNMFMEEPVGLVNSSNKIFTLSHSPYQNSLALYQNGFLTLQSGVHSMTFEYTLSSGTITYVTAPASGSIHIAQSYIYL